MTNDRDRVIDTLAGKEPGDVVFWRFDILQCAVCRKELTARSTDTPGIWEGVCTTKTCARFAVKYRIAVSASRV